MGAVDYEHKPVLIDEVMKSLHPRDGDFVIDCTFGRGGYSAAILQELDENGRVLALDADPDAIAHGERAFENEPRLVLAHSNYDRIVETLKELEMPAKADGIVFDLGVSSPQLDDATRGFSFRNDGPLDMRMNPQAGQSATEWLSAVSLKDLTRIISVLGEERMASRIARRIVESRDAAVLDSTARLAEIVYQAMPEKEKRQRKIHPATKTFQAIRMHVNQELEHLSAGLDAALDTLVVGGVLAVVSFHSLEDRMVKQLFRRSVLGDEVPDRLPLKEVDMGGNYEYVAKLVKPSEEETARNPRARSARLRAIKRIR
ncbi:MAG: 16S rRNA (cytosine(1402)-N(4))-methyltransferase RsmH [Gammaproteobacteria bacterium]|nr:16S rRNA (cytosine(1402)-N(4))-methyltransferase RsmH [Gammaproteobacteria bacterium]